MSLLAALLLAAAPPRRPPPRRPDAARSRRPWPRSTRSARSSLPRRPGVGLRRDRPAARRASAALLADHARGRAPGGARGSAGADRLRRELRPGSARDRRPRRVDALPGLSQKAVPERGVLQADAPGHGCGHQPVRRPASGRRRGEELIPPEAVGTVRFSARRREAVGGKVYMAREGSSRRRRGPPPGTRRPHAPPTCGAGRPSGHGRGVESRTAHAAFDPGRRRSAVTPSSCSPTAST